MNRLENWMLALAVLLAPWASVSVPDALGIPIGGPGVQPAILPLLVLVLSVFTRALRSPRLVSGEELVLVATLWIVVASVMTWSVVDMGLAGQRPWSKSLKQLVQWVFFVAVAVSVARVVQRERAPVVERALCAGVLLACVVALARGLVGADQLTFGVLDTNPSIASGSDELYLGHSFTGIARLRGTMPEPLMFGSYLIAATPLVALAAMARRGWARSLRLGLALLAAACLLGTWSRGAWLGAAVVGGALAVLWSTGRFGRPSWRVVAAVAAGLLAAGTLLAGFALQIPPWEVPGLLGRRIGQSLAGHDMSNMTRVWAWRAAWEMFRDAPVQGQGWGSYGFLFFRFASDAASGAHFGWPVPNALGLLLLAETGLVGLGLWIAALGPCLRALTDARIGAGGAVISCAVVGVLVHYATFSQWNLPHLWLLLGAAAGWARFGVNSPQEA